MTKFVLYIWYKIIYWIISFNWKTTSSISYPQTLYIIYRINDINYERKFEYTSPHSFFTFKYQWIHFNNYAFNSTTIKICHTKKM